jgi:hypothetical protein
MFEKEAEEYRKDLKSKFFLSEPQLDLACQGFKDGYNKANEWHYVKDGNLPNTETKDYTYIRRKKRYERHFTDYRVIKCFVLCQNEKGKITAEVGYFDCNKKCFLNNAEGIVIAWKEIVLPKLKESE